MANKFSAKLNARWACAGTLPPTSSGTANSSVRSRSRPRGRVSFPETEGLPHEPDHAVMDVRAKLRDRFASLRTQAYFSRTTEYALEAVHCEAPVTKAMEI